MNRLDVIIYTRIFHDQFVEHPDSERIDYRHHWRHWAYRATAALWEAGYDARVYYRLSGETEAYMRLGINQGQPLDPWQVEAIEGVLETVTVFEEVD